MQDVGTPSCGTNSDGGREMSDVDRWGGPCGMLWPARTRTPLFRSCAFFSSDSSEPGVRFPPARVTFHSEAGGGA
jgi:hypothetical protein